MQTAQWISGLCDYGIEIADELEDCLTAVYPGLPSWTGRAPTVRRLEEFWAAGNLAMLTSEICSMLNWIYELHDLGQFTDQFTL